MNINIELKISSPELMAALLALAEAIPQMKLGTDAANTLKIEQSKIVDAENVMEEAKEPETKGQVISLVDARKQLKEITKLVGQDKLRALLEKFGGSKLTEISEQRYFDLLEEAKKLNTN